jgi:hypothetical protein
VAELDVLPGVVRLKVGRPDAYGGGVVGGPRGVEGALEGVRQRGVVEGVVLGVAANADVRLGAGEASDVVQESVRVGVGVRVVPWSMSAAGYQEITEPESRTCEIGEA